MIRTACQAALSHHGFAVDEPVIIGVAVAGEQTIVAQGCPAEAVFYAASLGKQVTAACAAILCTRGQLDVDQPIARWLPELPDWARQVRVRHLIHHLAPIPHPFTEPEAGQAYTNDRVLEALTHLPDLEYAPGVRYQYSNTGYSLLGSILTRILDEPLTTWAQREVFAPLGMSDTCFWTGPQLAPPGVTPRIPAEPAPHAIGPGGMWTTGADLLQWNRGLATSALGVSELMHSAGQLDNGDLTDYAWGLGIREHNGKRIYQHGGGLGTFNAKLVRWHNSTDTVLVAALDDSTQRWLALANALIDHVATTRAP